MGSLGRTGLLAALLALTACGEGAKAPGGDPERMSDSEYDIARDQWLRAGNARSALEHALEAVKLNDQNAEAAHLVALLYLDFCSKSQHECRLEEAERYARRALEVKADFREARNTLGVVLIHRKRPAAAVAELRPLTEDILYQTPEVAWGNLGWAYLEQGDLDRAIDALRRSVAASPQFCVGHYRLGVAHERKGQVAQALESFVQAVEADPRCQGLQEAWAGRARMEARLGRRADAAASAERCATLSKATPAGKECAALRKELE